MHPSFSILPLLHFQALGQARTAEVQRDARIGEAEAKQESSIAEAKAEMQRMEAALSNQTEIAREGRRMRRLNDLSLI